MLNFHKKGNFRAKQVLNTKKLKLQILCADTAFIMYCCPNNMLSQNIVNLLTMTYRWLLNLVSKHPHFVKTISVCFNTGHEKHFLTDYFFFPRKVRMNKHLQWETLPIMFKNGCKLLLNLEKGKMYPINV